MHLSAKIGSTILGYPGQETGTTDAETQIARGSLTNFCLLLQNF